MQVIPDNFVKVVTSDTLRPSLKLPVISQANSRVSRLPINLQESDLATCLFDIFNVANIIYPCFCKNPYTTIQTH